MCVRSQIAIVGQKNPITESKLFWEYRKASDSIYKLTIWVSGHSGIEENERANELWQTGSELGPKLAVGIIASLFKETRAQAQ